MTKPTPAQWQQNTRSKVCSYEAYLRLYDWHYTKRYPFLMANNGGRGIPDINKSYYTNTVHREFHSRWLQGVCFAYFAWMLEKSEVSIPFDKGRQIKTKTGKIIRVQSKYCKPGKADMIVNFPIVNGIGTKIVNLEIKAKNDTMRPLQEAERDRVRRKGQLYEIIRNVSDLWIVVDGLDVVMVGDEWYWRGGMVQKELF